MIYCGIGSRKTPTTVLCFMHDMAAILAKANWTLRSGHADGADLAFEKGCIAGAGTKEIYLPWASFNSFHHKIGQTYYNVPTQEAYDIAAHFHPAWDVCNYTARTLMARNTHQIAGYDCNTPADLVICWTADGKASGGTGQAIRIANHLNIPVFNLKNHEDQNKLSAFLKEKGIKVS